MAITLHDIAKASGISVSTVSRILNKKTSKHRISKETEKLVLKKARELNYLPNQLARSLRLKKTETIGLVAPDISNPFFAYIIKSIQRVAHNLGYSIVVCDTNESLDLEVEHISLLASRGVDGLIVMPVGQKSAHLERLVKDGTPLVVVDRSFEELKASTVVVDNQCGAYEAVEHLIGHGHRRIAIVQGIPNTYTAQGRLRGYNDALRKHAIEIDEGLIVGKTFRQESGYFETKCLLKATHRPTAIFTTSDLITLGALQAIQEEDLDIPGDISLVAFDDIDSFAFFRCPITAVAQPKEKMGEVAVTLLLDQLKEPKNKEPEHITLRPRLIIRKSVGRVTTPADSGISSSLKR